MNRLHAIDYSIIIVFLMITIYFGFRFSKKQKSTQSYFAANGKIPSWAIGMSILATLISSITFLAYPGEGYSSNWILLVQGLMIPIVLLSMIWFIVPLYRRMIGLSTYEYFEKDLENLHAIIVRWDSYSRIFQKWERCFFCWPLLLQT